MAEAKSLEALLDERMKLHEAAQQEQATSSASLPPGMQRMQEKSVDQIVAELNRIPLFMTTLDETDGAGGENEELEALRALAYEGTRAEIAQNFREQGNELIREEKRYKEAREFYSKAIKALHDPRPQPNPEDVDVEEGPRVIDLDAEVEFDEEAEAKKERDIEEACLMLSAQTNKVAAENYGSCNRDCAAALRINPKNVKAWYRAASACLALDKVEEAIDAAKSGLGFEPKNAALKTLLDKALKWKDHLAELERIRTEREEKKRKEEATIKLALKQRNIPTRTTSRPPEMPEAAISLEDPLDSSSTLSFPTMFLYPAHAQTDFIKAFREDESLNDHLSYILPLPWDETGEYSMEGVECYIETIEGGLVKAGKKLPLVKLLSSGKVEVVDGLVRVNILPKSRVAQWIEEFKTRRGRG